MRTTPAEWFKQWNEAIEQGSGKAFYDRSEKPPQVARAAQSYAEAHKTEKEFADCTTPEKRTARAVWLAAQGRISFGQK